MAIPIVLYICLMNLEIKKLLLHGNSHALIELYNALYPSRTGKKGKYILFIKFPP